MATLTIRVDDALKQNAYAVFDDLGISPSDAIRTFLAYVADNQKMPMRQVWVDETDYLLASTANADRLMQAIDDIKAGKLIQRDIIDD